MSLLQKRKPTSKKVALKKTLQLVPPVDPIHKQHSDFHPASAGLTSYFSSSIGFKVKTRITRHKSPIKYGYLELSKQFKQKAQREESQPPPGQQNVITKEERYQQANQSLFFVSSKGFVVNPKITAETLQIDGLKRAKESARDLPDISDPRYGANDLKGKGTNSSLSTNFDFSTLPENREALNKTPLLKEAGRVSPSFMVHYKPRIKTPHISKLLDHSGDPNYTFVRARTQAPCSHQNSVLLTKENSVERGTNMQLIAGTNTSSTPIINTPLCTPNLTPSVLRPSKKFIINQSSLIKSNSNVDLRLQTTDNNNRPVNHLAHPLLIIKRKVPIFDHDVIASSGRTSINTNNSHRKVRGTSRQTTKILTGRSPTNSPRITEEIPALKLGPKFFAPLENELSSEGSTFRDYVQNAQNQDTTDDES